MKKVVIAAAVRTPIGSLGGALKNIPAEELVRTTIQGACDKIGLDPARIDEVVIGQAKQSTDAPNIARVAALMSDLPESVPAYTVHRQCASGMQAILDAARQIQLGESEIVIAGGVESMSTAPFYMRNARFGVGSGNTELLDPNVESQPQSQPASKYGRFNMIQTAENVASRYGVDRRSQDEFALLSQRRAAHASDSGRFRDEIVPVIIPQRKKEPIVFDTDEFIKRETDAEKLAKLRTVFEDGTVTAGNATGRNDGACALILMSSEKAAELGIRPLAEYLGAVAVGVDPRVMGIAPVAAMNKLTDKLQCRVEDFDLIEINEAFAAQAVACRQELGIDPEKLNVNGGAIALGHPLGCSGARICTTLIHEMNRRGSRLGAAAICVAGGLGMAIAFRSIVPEKEKL